MYAPLLCRDLQREWQVTLSVSRRSLRCCYRQCSGRSSHTAPCAHSTRNQKWHNLRGQAGDEMNKRASIERSHVANPDDPPVKRPPQGPRGVMPGPKYLGLQGRIAIVQGQVFLVAMIVIAQLWLVTAALYELL